MYCKKLLNFGSVDNDNNTKGVNTGIGLQLTPSTKGGDRLCVILYANFYVTLEQSPLVRHENIE